MATETLHLNQKHTDWKKVHDTRVRASELYEGEYLVKKRADRYLFPNKAETKESYERRLKRAHYDNWMSPSIAARQALLWAKSPTREEFGDLEKFIDDVDGFGTSADVFFMTVTERAMVEGLHWVLVDKVAPPDDVEASELTRQDDFELGLRPYMRAISGEHVFDWDVDGDRKLDWVVVAQNRQNKPGPGETAQCIPQRVVWTRQEWIIYEPDGKGHGESQINQLTNTHREDECEVDVDIVAPSEGSWVETKRGTHGLGVVPITPFYGIRERNFLGWPVTKDIVGKCIAVYNKESDRDTAEFKTNTPIPVIIAESNPEKVEVTSENGLYLPVRKDGPAPSVSYLEYQGAGIEQGRQSERDLIKRIFETQLQSMKSDTRQVQSEASLKQESKLFHTSMMAVACYAEMSEQQAWEIFALWEEISDWAGTVTYQKDFSDKLIEVAMVDKFITMTEKGLLSVETFLATLQSSEILDPELDLDEEIRRIDNDVSRTALPGFNAPPATPPDEGDDDDDDDDDEDDDAAGGPQGTPAATT